MTDEQLSDMVREIAHRRLQATLIYQKSIEEKQNAATAKLEGLIDKKCTQVVKELEGIVSKFDKLELRINELRALRLQAGLAYDPDGVDTDE